MQFRRIRLATDFPQPAKLSPRIDTANPNYRNKYHLVRSWLVEFDEDGHPWREIGLDEQELIVLAGPSKTDYGFWLDTGMQLSDFGGEVVPQEYFEKMWAASGVVAP